MDEIWICGPDEGGRVFISSIEVTQQCVFQVADRTMTSTFDAALCHFSEQAFGQIEPTAAGRRIVHVKARVARQPMAYFVNLMSSVIIHYQVHIQVVGYAHIDLAEKAQKLLVPMPPIAVADVIPLATSKAANREIIPCRS